MDPTRLNFLFPIDRRPLLFFSFDDLPSTLKNRILGRAAGSNSMEESRGDLQTSGPGRVALSDRQWTLLQLAATPLEEEEDVLDAVLLEYLHAHGFHETLVALGAGGDLDSVKKRKCARLACMRGEYLQVADITELPPLLRLKLFAAGVDTSVSAGQCAESAFGSIIATRAAELALQCGNSASFDIFSGALSRLYASENSVDLPKGSTPPDAAVLAAEVNKALRSGEETTATGGMSLVELLVQWRQWQMHKLSESGIVVQEQPPEI